jgi:hypothetical protein
LRRLLVIEVCSASRIAVRAADCRAEVTALVRSLS